MDSQEIRETFHRVRAYGQVTDHVRRSAGHTIFSGLFFCGIAYLVFNMTRRIDMFVIVYVGLGLLELGVGLWKKFAPSVECVLVDGLLSLGFAVSIFARQIVAIMDNGRPQPISIAIGLWILFNAVQSLRAYWNLRKAFTERPTPEQMNYVNSMMADIRSGVPEDDTTILDFAHEYDFKAQMLGEMAFVVDRGGDVNVFDAADLILERTGDSDVGRVILFRTPLPPVRIRPANWQNYCRWKGLPES
jgi:hypothetical protein